MSLAANGRARRLAHNAKCKLHQAVIAAMAVMHTAAWANPAGERVVAGTASVSRAGSTLTVNQTSNRAIINWQGFSIRAGELTRFVQPNAGSAVLNRVVTGDLSSIHGRLEANGKVFLINPNGILVGSTGVINTNGFVGSTRDITNAQFMAGGDLKFVGDSTKQIQNLGSIHAGGGDVFLIAHSVQNAGKIEAPTGTVGLAAGTEVVLKHSGDERLFVQTTVQVPGESGVANTDTGVVSAVRAELRAAGGNVYSLAVNNAGAIHASGIVEKDGRVLLTSAGGNISNSGTISARNADGSGGTVRLAGGRGGSAPATVVSSGTIDVSGATGGHVEITGDRVGLTGGARVDASGDGGGGTVLVGGDFQGKNPDVDTAQVALVGPNARITADAITYGEGGKVIVWADGTTHFAGAISARGGAQGGNGGFAEVSGKESLGFTGTVDLSAPHGSRGTLLLDPKNARIRSTGTTTANPDDVNDFSDNPSGDETISPTVLEATNANVVIQANNDVLFESSLQLVEPGASITAQAGRNVQLGSGVTVGTNGGAITLIGNESAGVVAAQRDSGAGVITMQADSVINSGGGNVLLHLKPTPDPLETAQFITVSTINAGSGTLHLRNDGAAANPLNASIAQTGNPLTANRLEITTPGQVVLGNTTNSVSLLMLSSPANASSGAFVYTNAGPLIIGQGGSGGPAVTANGTTIRTVAGDITLNGDVRIPSAGVDAGTLTLNAAGSVIVNSGIDASSAAPNSTVTYNAGQDVNFQGTILPGTWRGTLRATAGRDVTVASQIGAILSNNQFVTDFDAAENVAVNVGGFVGARNVTLTARNGSVTLNRPVRAVGDIANGQPTGADGNLTVTGRQGITGAQQSGGLAQVIAARGRLTLNSAAGSAIISGMGEAGELTGTVATDFLVFAQEGGSVGTLRDVTAGRNILIDDQFASGGLTIGGNVVAGGNFVGISTVGDMTFAPGTSILAPATGITQLATRLAGRILGAAGNSQPVARGDGALVLLSFDNVGTSAAAPLFTAVSQLEVQTTVGGVFLENTAPTLFIGPNATAGSDPSTLASGVRAGPAGGRAVSIVNQGNLQVRFDASGNRVEATGDVTLRASGANADLLIINDEANGVRSSNGRVILNAGRDLKIGQFTVGDTPRSGNVSGLAGIQLTGGNEIQVFRGSSVTAQGIGTISMNAPTIQVDDFGPNPTRIQTDGGSITLTTPIGGRVFLSGASGGGLFTTNAGGAGNININADTMSLNARMDAGGRTVNLTQQSSTRPVEIGFFLVEPADRLAIGDAELDRITAGSVAIGGGFGNADVPFTVTEAITRPTNTPTYGNLTFRNNGEVAINAPVTIGEANLAVQSLARDIVGGGEIRANNINLFAGSRAINLSGPITAQLLEAGATGNITLSGAVNAVVLDVNAPLGNIFVENESNNIVNLRRANYNAIFNLRDGSGGLNVLGLVDGGAPASAFISARGGTLVLQPGAQIFVNGPTDGLTLFSDTGFDNQAGANVLVPENGSRWLVFSPSPAATQRGGLAGAEVFSGEPLPATGNAFVFASARPAPPLPPPSSQSGGALEQAAYGGESPSVVTGAKFGLLDVELAGRMGPTAGAILSTDLAAPARIQAAAAVGSDLSRSRGYFGRQAPGLTNAALESIVRLSAEVVNSGRTVEIRSASPYAEAGGFIAQPSLEESTGRLRPVTVVMDDGTVIAVPRGGRVEARGGSDGQLIVVADDGLSYLAVGRGTVVAQSSDLVDPSNTSSYEVRDEAYSAINRAADAQLAARGLARVSLSGGRSVLISTFAGLPTLTGGGFRIPVSDAEITRMAKAAGLNRNDVAAMVAAGGGNLTPGVVAGMVAAGGGNLSGKQIAGMVAAGGLNLVNNQLTGNQVASIMSAMVAAGGMNLIGNDGSTLIGNDGSTMVAAGGGNLTLGMVQNLVAAGGGNIGVQGIAEVISRNGGKLIGNDGSTLIGNDGSTLIGLDGSTLIGLDGSTLIGNDGSTLAARISAEMVAAGGLNLIGNDGSTLVRQDGLGLVQGGLANFGPRISDGAMGFVNSGGAFGSGALK